MVLRLIENFDSYYIYPSKTFVSLLKLLNDIYSEFYLKIKTYN